MPTLDHDAEQDSKSLDTTYINTILVVFLVAAALAIDIGYMYVSEEDLANTADTAALAGAQAMKQRIQQQVQADPKGLDAVLKDQVQGPARNAAIDLATGKHKAAALVHIANNNTNRLTTENDLTVGFWNMSSQTYTPGATPVNAMQVRTRRTAESDSVGLGNIGTFLAKISGVQKFDYTPESISAFPARANANIALCTDACDSNCSYPNICTVPERRMTAALPDGRTSGQAGDRYAFTTLLHQVSATTKMSDLICLDLPPQAVCGNEIYTIRETDGTTLRDIESMMYNPNADASNKEYDKNGNLMGWWVIAPVTTCPSARQDNVFERHAVTRYALVRISRICGDGTAGCKQSGTSFKAPAERCGNERGLFIDRIACVSCGSPDLLKFPGLHPVLVKSSSTSNHQPAQKTELPQ